MAKTTYWTGAAGDGNWTNASNWNNGVPVSTDTVIFDGRGDSAGTIRALTSGLNQGAVNLALLHIKSGFDANGGDTGSPLEISASEIIFEGPGVWNIKCCGPNSTSNNEVGICIVSNTTGVLNISSNVNGATYASKWTEVVVKAGTLQIANSTDVRKIRMLAGLAVIGIDCVEVKTANAPMDIYGDGGQITTDSPLVILSFTTRR
ncbi:MAG: hypothetical protein A2Y07_11175 [Planctomycetes bacterium GWF2_50_10]|nr:MAG: hypothetical protein A2Y07_11175 [Planctomycetes bacterium GWF2_50_10]